MARRNDDKRLSQLEQELKTAASHPLSEAQLQQMLDSTLDRVSEYPTERTRPATHTAVPFLRLSRAAAAVLIIVGLLAAGYWLHQRSGSETLSAPQTLAGMSLLEESYTAWIVLPEKSMLSEMQKLTRDAQYATAFLINCVPADPSNSTLNGTK